MMGKFKSTGWIAAVMLVSSLILTACAQNTPSPTGVSTQPPAATLAPDATGTASPAGATRLPPTAGPSAQTATSEVDATTPPADAVSFPDPQQYQWQTVVDGLDEPIGMAVAGDGSNRLFLVEKGGRILVVQNDRLTSAPFLDLTDRVGSSGSEQGLLGLDFSPNYTQNGFFYVNYTDHNGNTVISRFQVTSDPNRADPDSERILLTQNQPYANHNGGSVVFGPDGYLYLGLGDGGSAGDPQNNAQNLETLLGKILRIDVSQADGYAIPPDNPFQDGKAKHEIWAYGLRNPWRFSFDRLTGDLYIADVGQDQWEEVNFLPAGSPGGANFGWPYKEANHEFKGQPPAGAVLVDPIFEYNHSLGCSITGGYVYRGQMPEWQGIYFFGDYCSGNVWALLPGGSSQSQLLWKLPGIAIPAFGQDENGELYVVNIAGSLERLVKK